jgi:hypothetical protein
MGTQAQTVTCRDDRNRIVADSLCTSYAGTTQPPSSRSCTLGPCSCSAASRSVNGHTYSVPLISSSSSQVVTSNAVAIPNGSCTYSQNFVCNTTTLNTSGNESPASCTCNSGYSWDGATCITNPSVINGACGSADNTTVSSYPSTNHCNDGNKVDVDTTADDGTYNWNCNSPNSGTNASCSANFSSTPPPPPPRQD